MKNFFKTVLAVIVGLFAYGILQTMFMLILFFGFTVIAASGGGSDVAENSILELDLNYDIKERLTSKPLNIYSLDIESQEKPGLKEIIQCIRDAEQNDNIKGIYLKMGAGMSTGFATVEEIRNELIAFKKSGKFVYAYGEFATEKMYYLASCADKVYLNPKGGMEFNGFGTKLTFFKRMLDKLGVNVQVFYAGKFKSATEPFRFEKMSEPNKLQVREFLSDFYSIFLDRISTSRNVSKEELIQYADSLTAEMTLDLKHTKLIDGAIYYDEFLDILQKKSGVESYEDLSIVSLTDYYKPLGEESKLTKITGDHIAVVYAEGDIIDGKGTEDQIGSETYARIFRKLRHNDDVKAVVLRVNSGGGSALASDIIWRETQLLKKKKPFVVSFGDVAASGGYYIAAGADKIFAEPNTITGSIGVFGIIPEAGNLLNEKLGITFDEVELNPHAVLGIDKPLDEFESRMIQRGVDSIYADFLQTVASGRNKTVAEIDSIAQGRVWSGVRAKEIGLVDELGNLDAAIVYAAKKANVKNLKTADYPRQKEWFEHLIEDLTGKELKAALIKQFGAEYRTYFNYLEKIQQQQNMRGIQARMPYEIVF